MLSLQFEPIQVTRFLVNVEATGLPLTLVLNKCDLVTPEELQARLQQVASWGYSAVAVSCVTGEGLEELQQKMVGRVSVVAGPSGAGKSSLINALRLGQHRQEEEEELWQWEWEQEALEGEEGWAAASSSGEGCEGEGEKWQMDVVPRQVAQAPTSWGEVRLPRVAAAATGAAGGNGNGSSSSRWAGSSRNAAAAAAVAEREESHTSTSSSGRTLETSTSGSSDQEHLLVSQEQQQHDQVAPGDFLVVGEMSKIGRGMHTTRTVTLLQLPKGGAVADTPGFGLPTLEGVGSRQLKSLFPEFEAAAEAAEKRCRFDDCMHVAEPDCVVLDAALERHSFYLKFLAEIKVRRHNAH